VNKPTRWLGWWLAWGLTLLLAGCDFFASQEPSVEAQATIVALSTQNAQLAAQVAAQVSTPVPPLTDTTSALAGLVAESVVTTTVSAEISSAAQTTATSRVGTTSAVEPGSAPRVLVELPLAPSDQRLVDLRLDPAANRLYVSDSAGQLFVLDATSYDLLATLPAGGLLTLDPTHDRLYSAPNSRFYHPAPALTVIDTAALTITGVISGYTDIALDLDHNRVFIGRRIASPLSNDDPPVQILAADTLTLLATSPQAGLPVYNPVRDELLIVAYSLFLADPATGVVTRDLFPEISAQECRGCVGLPQIRNAFVFAASNLLAIERVVAATSGGPGLIGPPLIVDAATLEPLGGPAPPPVLQPTCGSAPTLTPPVAGRIYQPLSYARYVVYNNLRVFDTTGQLLTWREGLSQPYINANTGQGYSGNLVLDLATLTPVGALPVDFCVFLHDADRGLLYGSRHHELVVLAETGGAWLAQPPQPAPGLPDRAVSAILVSPDFASDQTLFVLSGGRSIYRSADGGQGWARLHPATPGGDSSTRTLAISPNFAQDGTLFLASTETYYEGHGVWRSTDRGDTWQPLWNGLHHLRVQTVALSPQYASDGTLVALAPYVRLDPWEMGTAVHRSSDAGLTWTQTLTVAEGSPPLDPATLLPPPTEVPAVRLRIADFGRAVEGEANTGRTRFTLPQPHSGLFLTVVPSSAGDDTAYLLGEYGLWRVRDGGAIVEPWVDDDLAGRTYENKLSALAVTPPSADGGYQLVIGTNAGELWLLDPATMPWGAPLVVTATAPPISAAAITPTVPLTPTPTMTITPALLITDTPPLTAPTLSTAPLEPLTGDPPAGLFRPTGVFESQWSGDPELQSLLGWATSETPTNTPLATQPFENGWMIWRGDEAAIYVLYNDTTWQRFDDTFVEGEAERDPSIQVPAGRLQPVRGFGKLWRAEPSVRARIGWATDKEEGLTSVVHTFERGVLVRVRGLVYLIATTPGGPFWRFD
jgi:hypothetical protein